MKKNIALLTVLLASLCVLVACQDISNWFKSTQEQFSGLTGTIRTFDEEAQVIDSISGKSISIQSDDRFDITDVSGNVSKESSVLDITVGKNNVIHVGSTLVFSEKGLTDLFDAYSEKVDIEDTDRSLPFVNRFFNTMKNSWSGESKLILIRSQNGTPLATYFGDKVSTHSPDGIPNTTYLLIDGKRLIVYRADFTIYDTALLEN